jgi:hypothetical protein
MPWAPVVRNCEINDVYQKLPIHWNQYRIELAWKQEDKIGREHHSIVIQDSRLAECLERLILNVSDRECFAYGMEDIDICRVKDEDDMYYFSHSPLPTYHSQFVLKKGELQKLHELLANKKRDLSLNE